MPKVEPFEKVAKVGDRFFQDSRELVRFYQQNNGLWYRNMQKSGMREETFAVTLSKYKRSMRTLACGNKHRDLKSKALRHRNAARPANQVINNNNDVLRADPKCVQQTLGT